MAEKKTIEWQAHEHEHYERGVDWYWGVGLVAAAGAGLAIFFGNLLFGILIIVSGAALAIQAATAPKYFTFKISREGVHVGEQIFSYSDIESFWVDHREHERKILLKSKRLLTPMIVVPLGEKVNERAVRNLLGEHLPEEELHEPALQRVMELLGF